jgi:hypothetical protein
MGVEIDIAVAKFKAIKRAREQVEKRERDLGRLVGRLSREDFILYAKETEEINGTIQ